MKWTFALLFFFASTAHAADSSRRLILPIAGRVTAGGGVEYTTTLWMTNVTAHAVHARVAFLPAGQANPEPRFATVELAAEQTVQLPNVTETLLHQPGKLGALLIEGDGALACSALVATQTHGAGFVAIPIEQAIGRGASTVLQGAGAGAGGEFRYNVHLVETNRSAVEVLLSVHDASGREVRSQHVLLRELEALTVPVANAPAEATVRIRVIKGSGKLVAAGSRIAVSSSDPTAFQMTSGETPQPSMPRGELAAWIIAALAIVLSSLLPLAREKVPRSGG
jgi:hypothetical protein